MRMSYRLYWPSIAGRTTCAMESLEMGAMASAAMVLGNGCADNTLFFSIILHRRMTRPNLAFHIQFYTLEKE